jgi:hypothetical protein
MPVEALALVVFAGAFAQSATGVGFGVIAGPFLLLAYGYERAVVETAIFSLLVALVSATKLFESAEIRATVGLSVTLPLGVALGLATLSVVPLIAVLGFFGLMLTGLGAALLREERARAAVTSPISLRHVSFGREMVVVGVLAGAGAALFAAPGPAAAWGLARTRLPARAIRGTLAVYFVVAYATILVAFAVSGATARVDVGPVLVMGPICTAGAIAGVVYGDRLPGNALRMAIGLIVAASGLTILASLAWRLL